MNSTMRRGCCGEPTSDVRVLHRLKPNSTFSTTALCTGKALCGIVVDVETTGLSHTADEVIELAMVKFQYSTEGQILRVLDTFSCPREPDVPIPPDVQKLTGITTGAVAGKSIAPDAVASFVGDADLIVAHNAQFDRPFCEHLSPCFERKPWGCSLTQIDWASRGHQGTRLAYLLNDYGLFHDGHRALDDCYAVLEVLSRAAAGGGSPPFKELLDAAHRTSVRVYADRAPMAHSPTLKGRSYRWCDGSAGPRAWWKEVEECRLEAEIAFLRSVVYQDALRLFEVVRVTPLDRFSRSIS